MSGRPALSPQAVLDVLTQRPNVCIGSTTCDYEVIGHVRYVLETKDDDVVRLVLQQDRSRPLDELYDRWRPGIRLCRWRNHCSECSACTTVAHVPNRAFSVQRDVPAVVGYCLMTQTLISGLTSACSRMGTRKTPSVLRGSCRSTCRFSIVKPCPSS
jgi:hypothetical protein